MTIQFNADNNLTVHEEFRIKMSDVLTDKLKRFDEEITRIEVHLSDENGGKSGVDDKSCLLEARIAGRTPVAVTATGSNYERALDDATDKLKSTLSKITERRKEY